MKATLFCRFLPQVPGRFPGFLAQAPGRFPGFLAQALGRCETFAWRGGLKGAAVLAAALALSGWIFGIPLRAAEQEAPEILSSDLGATQTVQTGTLTATFVIVGNAPVKSVKINGEPQVFTPADTVQIAKTFQLTEQVTVISVAVEDDKGNSRQRDFIVTYAQAPVAKKWSVRGVGQLAYEVDDNPTDDVGLPFSVSGVKNIKGVIPASARPDNRTTAVANVAGVYGGATVFGGAFVQQYQKEVNKFLNATLWDAGAGYRFRLAETSDFVANLIYSDLSLGQADYATLLSATGAFELRTGDEKMFKRHTLGVDVTDKSFAAKSQKAGTEAVAKWDYFRLNPVTSSTYEFLLKGGNATEGIKATDYNYAGFDSDWHTRWKAGFRWDLGFGLQDRNYPNDTSVLTKQSPFGNNRVDYLVRASTGLGWQWNPLWSAMLNYRYLTDLSSKAPYIRDIYGLTVAGGF